MQPELTPEQMQMGMESCLGKTVMAGVMGGGLGAMFGLFMASVRPPFIQVKTRWDTYLHSIHIDALRHTNVPTSSRKHAYT